MARRLSHRTQIRCPRRCRRPSTHPLSCSTLCPAAWLRTWAAPALSTHMPYTTSSSGGCRPISRSRQATHSTSSCFRSSISASTLSHSAHSSLSLPLSFQRCQLHPSPPPPPSSRPARQAPPRQRQELKESHEQSTRRGTAGDSGGARRIVWPRKCAGNAKWSGEYLLMLVY